MDARLEKSGETAQRLLRSEKFVTVKVGVESIISKELSSIADMTAWQEAPLHNPRPKGSQ